MGITDSNPKAWKKWFIARIQGRDENKPGWFKVRWVTGPRKYRGETSVQYDYAAGVRHIHHGSEGWQRNDRKKRIDAKWKKTLKEKLEREVKAKHDRWERER